MDLKTYQEKTEITAVYPNVGNNIIYPTLGLCGEVGEVFEKLLKLPYDSESIKKELGDILWYCARMCSELSFSLNGIYNDSLDFILQNNLKFEEVMIISASNIGEIVKKISRDKNGECDMDSAEKIRNQLIVILYCLEAIIEDVDEDIESIAQINIDKLFSRRDRGVIQGSGDDR